LLRNMLVISAGEWDGINHRPHHFARRAAESGWQVFYVEPPASIIAPLKSGKNRQRMLQRWRNWRQGPRVVEDNITIIAPPPILPFGNRYRLINKINQRLISNGIRKGHREQVNGAPLDLYTYLPSAVDLLPLFNFAQIIYDCVDDHAAFTGTHSVKTLGIMERELCERADLCLATAEKLLEDRKEWNPNFHLVSNGVEYCRFAVDTAVEEARPAVAADQPAQPVIGFVGGISDWINIELIADTAKLLPYYRFTLIGPIDTDTTVLTDQPNIELLGAKPYEELPNYLKTFSVCLIPFRINQLTASVNPIKMYEYLAAGKPVVATPMPEVVRFADNNAGAISIAATAVETAATIRELLQPEHNSAEAIAIRRKHAYNNSWDSRWERILSLIPTETTTHHHMKAGT